MSAYTDILYRLHEGVAHITINRPDVYNAFRARTCEELLHALSAASAAREVGVVVRAKKRSAPVATSRPTVGDTAAAAQ